MAREAQPAPVTLVPSSGAQVEIRHGDQAVTVRETTGRTLEQM